MEFEYLCMDDPWMEPASWNGYVQILNVHWHFFEADVTARESRFHIICGQHPHGNYLCIPNWNIGSELGRLHDRGWNLERLMNSFPRLSHTDAVSIVDALDAISQKMKLTI